MRCPGVEIGLVGCVLGGEYGLRIVSSRDVEGGVEFTSFNRVSTAILFLLVRHSHTCDGNWPIDALDLRSLKPARMRNEADIDALALGQEPRHVLASEAVTHAADSADVKVVVDVVDGQTEDVVDFGGRVAEAPFCQVEGGAFAVVGGDGIAVEEVGEDDSIACACNGVGEAIRLLVL